MVSKTLALRKAINTELRKLCDSVYYDRAVDEEPFPRAIFSIDEVSKDEILTLCQLEINVLDYGADDTACEILADSVLTTLHKYHYLGDEIQFAIYRDRRHPVQEEDRKIIRRRLTFEVRMHERS